MENGAFAPKDFHNIFKYMIFQRRQKVLLWRKGLTLYKLVPLLKAGSRNTSHREMDAIIHQDSYECVERPGNSALVDAMACLSLS